MDFIKHDETPRYLWHPAAALVLLKKAPEVLTGVALLCVVKKPSSKGGGKIKNK